MRAILLKENPLWKLPERRVARYLKRHLKARKSPTAAEIEADEDEVTIFTATSASVKDSVRDVAKEEETNATEKNGDDSEKKEEIADEPQAKVNEEEKENAPESESLMGKTIKEEEEEVNEGGDKKVEETETDKTSQPVVEKGIEAYVDDNDKSKSSDGIACFGQECIIS